MGFRKHWLSNPMDVNFFLSAMQIIFYRIIGELKKWTTSITDMSLRNAQKSMQQDRQILFQTQINVNVVFPPSQNERWT